MREFKVHLNTVVTAIDSIDILKNKVVELFKEEITTEVEEETKAYVEVIKNITLDKQLVAASLIVGESSETNKKMLIECIDTFMQSNELTKVMITHIKDKKSAEDIAITISFISMYVEYLTEKKWEGPSLDTDKLKYKTGIRKLFGIKDIDFSESYLYWNNYEEYKNIRTHLSKVDTNELINELMTAYTYIALNKDQEDKKNE